MPTYNNNQHRDYSTQSERKMRSFRRSIRRTATFSVLIAIILGISYLITYVIEAPQKKAQAQSIAEVQAAQREEEARLLAEQYGPAYGPEADWLTKAPTALTAQQIVLPGNGRVEMRFFETALFVGDSLTQGLDEYANGIQEAKYAAYRGMGPKTMLDGVIKNEDGTQSTYFDIFKEANPEKIYIMLGANSLNAGTTDEAFIKYYGDLLDKLKAELPGVEIYVQSILPVSAEKAADKNFSLERINSLNEQISRLAQSRDLYYLNIASAVSDDTGSLRAEYDAQLDGIHMNNSGYGAWKEYLITHTKHSADNPYVMGSPFYKESE